MKFVLVNGRTPRTQSLCALCCESIGESYLRDIRVPSGRGLDASQGFVPLKAVEVKTLKRSIAGQFVPTPHRLRALAVAENRPSTDIV
jgi:hypothetical protein